MITSRTAATAPQTVTESIETDTAPEAVLTTILTIVLIPHCVTEPEETGVETTIVLNLVIYLFMIMITFRAKEAEALGKLWLIRMILVLMKTAGEHFPAQSPVKHLMIAVIQLIQAGLLVHLQ